MSQGGPISERVHRMVEELTQGTPLELVEVTFGREGSRKILRIYIDKEGGVNISDCQALSERIDLALEVEDFIPGAYVLEVSSPGLTRPLKKKSDFERFTGRLARITTRRAVNGRKRFLGRLQAVRNDTVLLGSEEGQTWEIPLAAIAKARLEIEF